MRVQPDIQLYIYNYVVFLPRTSQKVRLAMLVIWGKRHKAGFLSYFLSLTPEKKDSSWIKCLNILIKKRIKMPKEHRGRGNCLCKCPGAGVSLGQCD